MQIGVRPRNRKQPPWHGPLLGRAHADGLGGLARAAARGVAGQEAAPLAAWVDGIHRTRWAVDTARQVDAAWLGLRSASGAARVPRAVLSCTTAYHYPAQFRPPRFTPPAPPNPIPPRPTAPPLTTSTPPRPTHPTPFPLHTTSARREVLAGSERLARARARTRHTAGRAAAGV